eukprot:CAMPEP_0116839208 /NCGR_PEP_ID=MMETSP0418-20121206/9639_1 /TAXON_ID=1158023 /ORGANISM="Astrosyne radiata, Strain 13vi08-1A" /LENGTH=47 /DNA_ID= /DNA_START= /DNA_END= /DNA_ORIENTATION=
MWTLLSIGVSDVPAATHSLHKSMGLATRRRLELQERYEKPHLQEGSS